MNNAPGGRIDRSTCCLAFHHPTTVLPHPLEKKPCKMIQKQLRKGLSDGEFHQGTSLLSSNWHAIQCKQVKNVLYQTVQTGGILQIKTQLQTRPVVQKIFLLAMPFADMSSLLSIINKMQTTYFMGKHSIVKPSAIYQQVLIIQVVIHDHQFYATK